MNSRQHDFSLTKSLAGVNRDVRRALADVGGANSPEMRAAATVLARSVRRVLSTRGGGGPSAPGSPPHRQSGRLARSVVQGVVGTGRRVAVMWFTAPLLEAGVNTSLPTRSGAKRRRTAGQARRQLVIAPRPFAQLALDRVRDQLADAVLEAHLPRLGGLG